MRAQWACPDVAPERAPGTFLIVPGTAEEFPECPAAWLRMPSDLEFLEHRFGKPAFAPHLSCGQHPAQEISMYAQELESGARLSSSLSPPVLMLTHLFIRERAKFRDFDASERKKVRNGT